MALCKHGLETGCADCGIVPPGVISRAEPARDFGPWFCAQFGGGCDGCGGSIEPGDRIRADGEGGWLCEDCGEVTPEFAVRDGSPVPEYLIPVSPGGLSLAAFLNQYREES